MRAAAQRVIYGITSGMSANRLLRGQLAWLRENGWDVHLAVDPDERARAAAQREAATIEPLPMRRGIAPVDDMRSLLRWLRLIRRLRPAVVNVSTPKAGLLGGLAAFMLRVPRRVYVLRGLRLEGTRGAMGVILWLMEWVSMAVATDVVVVSRSLGAEARHRQLVGPGRCLLVGSGSSNGVHAALVAERVAATDADALRERLGIAQVDFVVGYVGRVTGDKGIESLLAAVAGLPDDAGARLLLVGPIEDEQLKAQSAALGDRAIQVGWSDDPWSYYAVMDVLCLPTRREGFPNVVLEAASAGVPAITTRATGAVDSVVDGVTGLLVDIDDAKGLCAALMQLAENGPLRVSMGQAARVRAQTAFQPEYIWRGIESVMQGTPAKHVERI